MLTAFAALDGLGGPALAALHRAPTVDQALAALGATDPGRAERLRQRLAAAIEQRSLAYLARYGQVGMAVGAVLFDRSRQVCAQGPMGRPLFAELAAVRLAGLDGGGT